MLWWVIYMYFGVYDTCIITQQISSVIISVLTNNLNLMGPTQSSPQHFFAYHWTSSSVMLNFLLAWTIFYWAKKYLYKNYQNKITKYKPFGDAQGPLSWNTKQMQCNGFLVGFVVFCWHFFLASGSLGRRKTLVLL